MQLDGYAKPSAPVLSTAAVNEDELVLTYGEALDATSVPVEFVVDQAGLPDTLTLELAYARGTWRIAFSDKVSSSTSTRWVFEREALDGFHPSSNFEMGKVATVCLRTATQTCPAARYGDPPSAPLAPSAPTVSAVSGQSDRLTVSWMAPSDEGSAITDYDVQYCQGAATACTTDANFTEHAFTGTTTAATIGMLMASTEHQVQVRASNAEGTGPWSASGAGTTAAASDGRVLVSNTGQSRVGAGFARVRLNINIAQGFRTGMTPDGYVLSSLELLLVTAGAAMSDLTVTLRNASGDDPGSTVLATFVNPDSPALSTTVERTFRFTLSEDEELDPDTPYFIHLNNNHATDDMGVARTPSDNQDSGGLNDWGIDDIAREQQSGDWIDIFGNLAIPIRLDGYAKTPAPVLSTAGGERGRAGADLRRGAGRDVGAGGGGVHRDGRRGGGVGEFGVGVEAGGDAGAGVGGDGGADGAAGLRGAVVEPAAEQVRQRRGRAGRAGGGEPDAGGASAWEESGQQHRSKRITCKPWNDRSRAGVQDRDGPRRLRPFCSGTENE